MGRWLKVVMAVSVLAFTLSAAADASAQPYELTENEVTEVSQFNTPEVSLFGIKLGDILGRSLHVRAQHGHLLPLALLRRFGSEDALGQVTRRVKEW